MTVSRDAYLVVQLAEWLASHFFLLTLQQYLMRICNCPIHSLPLPWALQAESDFSFESALEAKYPIDALTRGSG